MKVRAVAKPAEILCRSQDLSFCATTPEAVRLIPLLSYSLYHKLLVA